MVNIKYSRLSTSEAFDLSHLKWAKNRLPIAFLKQQILLTSLVIGSLILFILTHIFTPSLDYDLLGLSDDMSYGVIVDCGSSGSRAHIFTWRSDPRANPIELVRDEAADRPLSKHITPGLSSLKNNPDRASDYMEPIMEFISESIPPERHLDTPVYFLATAGMRMLDESTQKKIFTDITRDLRVKFDFPRIKSQVISGAYEGFYSWLSLNADRVLYNGTENSPSLGMIELGGASAQVTFELNPEVENAILKELPDPDSIATFKEEQELFDTTPHSSVRLFATTFLGLGVNSARESAIDLLVKDYIRGTGSDEFKAKKNDLTKFVARLNDPCLALGSSEVVLRPAAVLHDSRQTIGHVIKHQGEETFRVQIEGDGNFLNCMDLLGRVMQIAKSERLNCDHSPVHGPCPMTLLGTKFIPYNHYAFVGLSEMFFTTNEMMDSAGPFNRSKVLHETKRICTTKYNKLLELYPTNDPTYNDRVLYECFKASWLLTLLHNFGFKMPSNYDHFQTVDRLNGREIDWTVGAMLAKVALNKGRSDRR